MKRYIALLTTMFLMAFDRATKQWALIHLQKVVFLWPFFEFECCFNKGISWGLFNGAHVVVQSVLTCIIIGLLVVVAYATQRAYRAGKEILPYLLVLGGGLSNVFDRLFYGAVIDFIGLQYTVVLFDFAFNIADVMIVCGLLLLVLGGSQDDEFCQII